jgi:hypothetical protein
VTPLSPGSGDLAAYQAALAELGPREGLLGVIVAMATAVMGVLVLSAVVAGTPEAALGQPVSFRGALARFVARLAPLLGLSVVILAVETTIALTSAAQLTTPTIATSATIDLAQIDAALLPVVVVGIVEVLLAALTLYLYVRWFVILPLIIVDGLGLRAAMQRSAQLTRGSRWYILAVLLLLVLIQGALTIAVELVAVALGLLLGAGGIDAGVSLAGGSAFGTLVGHLTAFSSIVSLLMVAIFYPVIGITMAILRSDFRWRAEAMAALAASQATDAARPAPPVPTGAEPPAPPVGA